MPILPYLKGSCQEYRGRIKAARPRPTFMLAFHPGLASDCQRRQNPFGTFRTKHPFCTFSLIGVSPSSTSMPHARQSPIKTLQMDFWDVGVNWVCARIIDAKVTGRSHGDICAFANFTN